MHDYAIKLFHELANPLKVALSGSLSGPSTIPIVLLCDITVSIAIDVTKKSELPNSETIQDNAIAICSDCKEVQDQSRGVCNSTSRPPHCRFTLDPKNPSLSQVKNFSLPGLTS